MIFRVHNTGKVPRFFDGHKDAHIRTWKTLTLDLINSPSDFEENETIFDVEVIDNNKTVALIEIKLNDLESSLNTGRLKSELQRYSEYAAKVNCNQVHLVCGGYYKQRIIARTISLLREFPWVQLHLHETPEKAIDKTVKIGRFPPEPKMEFIPTLVKTSKKSFALSMAALRNGVDEGLGNYLAPRWYNGITEGELAEHINKYYDDGKDRKKLPYNFYMDVKDTWLREKPKIVD